MMAYGRVIRPLREVVVGRTPLDLYRMHLVLSLGAYEIQTGCRLRWQNSLSNL